MDDFSPEIFENFNSDYDSDFGDEIIENMNPEPLDLSDLEDWDDELGMEDEY